MQFILALRHSNLLSQCEIMLITFMLGGLLTLLIAIQQDTSPGFLLVGNPRDRIDVIINQNNLLGCKYFDLIRSSLSVIFHLHGGHEVIPFLVGQGEISLIFILHFIMHGCWKYFLSCNMDIILREFVSRVVQYSIS